ncbi:MAG: hypothetical protein K8T20_21025 [Planctomycetes bacterium]|nr:hypothetical protein [Planctomycetota bacterium]
MRLFAIPVLLAGLALAATADDTVVRPGPWAFRPGQTYTYEAKTEFAYSNGSYEVDTGCGKYKGEKTTHQVETLQLKATVTAVGDDGAARITFEVVSVAVEANDGEGGVKADWDSHAKGLPQEGYLRWASIAGHKFDAIIAPDGVIRELANPDWPTSATKSADRPSMETKASKNHRDPTSKKAWLELIFGTAPQAKLAVTKMHLPIPEMMEIKPDGAGQCAGDMCSKVKLGTQDKPESAADFTPPELRKRGESWWSPKAGSVVRVELSGAEEAKLYKAGLLGTVKWTIELKERGQVNLTPGKPDTATPK